MHLLILSSFVVADPTYVRDVAPIIAKHCTICHSDQTLDDPETSGGLSLDSFERITNRKGKPIVQPRKSADSELIHRLTTSDVKKRMPKDEAPLSPEEIGVIRRWIDAGMPKGESNADTDYHRRETGRKRPLRELIVKLDVAAPAKSFGQASAGQLSLAVPLQPLARMTALALSPDGSLLASAGHRRVVVWNLKKAIVEHQFTDPIGMTSALAFSPNGKTLYAVGGEAGLRGEVRAYHFPEGKLSFAIGLSTEVLTGLSVHSDGKRIVLAGMDRKIRMYDVEQRKELWSFRGHSDFIWSVAFSKDGLKVVSSSKDKSIKIWSSDTGTVEQTLTGHRDEVFSAVFLPDASSVMSGGKEPQVYVSKLGKGGRRTLVGGHGIALQQFSWNADFTRLASAGADRTLRIWKPNGTPERTLQGASDVVQACAISNDGKAAFGACGDGIVQVWSVDSGRVVARLFVGDTGSSVAGPWLAVAANGAVSLSDDLTANSHWIVGAEEISFDKTPAELRRTESLAEALRGSPPDNPLLTPPAAPPKKGPPKVNAAPKKIAAK
jgi:hypothetical protein